MIDFNFEYWYVFPLAIIIATLANASGFSGAVLFQPFFNFVLGLPLHQSIATGIATETLGMSSGATRYYIKNQIDIKTFKIIIPYVLLGVISGFYLFQNIPKSYLRFSLGLIIMMVAAQQLWLVYQNHLGTLEQADIEKLKKFRWLNFISGAFSATTGTGVAELNQPLIERQGNLHTKKANATAIGLEACADILISCLNLTLGNIRLDILIFSGSGVIIGAQLGVVLSKHLPSKLLKIIFSIAIMFIGLIYLIK